MNRGFNLEYVSKRNSKLQETLDFNKYTIFEYSFKLDNYIYNINNLYSISNKYKEDIDIVSDDENIEDIHYITYYYDNYDMTINKDFVNTRCRPSLSSQKDESFYYITEQCYVLTTILRKGFYNDDA